MPTDQSESGDDKVEIIAPSFRLQKKLGGPASRILTPVAYEKAQKALDDAIPPIAQEVGRLVKELELAVHSRAPNARDHIWETAHEIRGLAGTAGKKSLGEAANIMCRYLNGSESGFKADPAILFTITFVAVQALKEGADEDPMITTLLTDSARAVSVQRAREGRGESD